MDMKRCHIHLISDRGDHVGLLGAYRGMHDPLHGRCMDGQDIPVLISGLFILCLLL